MSVPEVSESPAYAHRSRSLEVTANRAYVLAQLNRLLSSPFFNKSRRCRPFLEYVVTEALNGRGEHLKERSIGIDVFGRPPAYDTNEDRIVRAAAIDVRRRIAQYYQDPEHVMELRIEVPSGSYMPRFLEPTEPHGQPTVNEQAHEREVPAPLVEKGTRVSRTTPSGRARIRGIALAALLCVTAIGVLLFWAHSSAANRPIRAFWAPFLGSDRVIVVLGNEGEVTEYNSPQTAQAMPSVLDAVNSDRVGFADSQTAAQVAALLSSMGKTFEIRRGGTVTLRDLRGAPAVVIGALSNPWSRTLQQGLRYQFKLDESAQAIILLDQKDPAHPGWKFDSTTPYAELKEDRAVVSRFVDLRTEQPVLLIAGLGRDGTMAAGEFVTNPAFLRALAASAPKGWETKNIQVVIATDIVNGHGGIPRIVTTYYW
ncbi:MAG TPA: hypothetical protein VKG86_07725 [Terracidiphilus sp.]|nr:hypothetical protein [Terracidiphilus sp.]